MKTPADQVLFCSILKERPVQRIHFKGTQHLKYRTCVDTVWSQFLWDVYFMNQELGCNSNFILVNGAVPTIY